MRARYRPALVLALAVSLPLSLAGCGREKPAGRPRVAMVIANAQLNFAREMAAGFTAATHEVGGVDSVAVGPETVDGAAQLKKFQELTASSPDGIAVETLAPELFSRRLAAAARSGIPLIAVDTTPAPGAEVTTYVGNDNYHLGVELAREAIKRLPAHAAGKVILGTSSPGVPVLDLRAKGMRDEFRKQLPDVRVVGPFDTAQEVPANQIAWQQLVTANPGALAFLGTGDADAFNLAAVRRRTHGRWLAGAFDLDPKSLAGVKDGQLFALMSPEHFLKGAIAGRLIAQHAKGGADLPEGWIYTPGLTVTAANVDQILRRQESDATRADWFRAQVTRIIAEPRTYLRRLVDAR
jgi:ribose transport system substrate-binding protein